MSVSLRKVCPWLECVKQADGCGCDKISLALMQQLMQLLRRKQ